MTSGYTRRSGVSGIPLSSLFAFRACRPRSVQAAGYALSQTIDDSRRSWALGNTTRVARSGPLPKPLATLPTRRNRASHSHSTGMHHTAEG